MMQITGSQKGVMQTIGTGWSQLLFYPVTGQTDIQSLRMLMVSFDIQGCVAG